MNRLILTILLLLLFSSNILQEFCYADILGDLSNDRKVDFNDFAILALDWHKVGEIEPNQVWISTYDGNISGRDYAQAIAVDKMGNIYVTGTSPTSGTDDDYCTIKYDSNSNEIWVARYNGPANGGDYAHDIVIDNQGNILVTGTSAGEDVVQWDDFATVKYDPCGNELWVARYDGSYGQFDSASILTIDNSGNIIVSGGSRPPGNTNWDYLTVKYDCNGNQLWMSTYNGPGDYIDGVYATAVDANNNIYITGGSWGLGTSEDYCTIKYDSNGNEIWVARYNSPVNDMDEARGIVIDDQGNVFVTGGSKIVVTPQNIDCVTIKYDTNGNELIVRNYNGPANSTDWGYNIGLDSMGNVYVTGTSIGINTSMDYATIKYDCNLNQIWVARYDGPASDWDRAYAMDIDIFGNVYVTGDSEGLTTSFDYCTVKYDANGNQIWVARYSSFEEDSDKPSDILVDDSGNVYVTGTSDGGYPTLDNYATVKYTQNMVCKSELSGDINIDCCVDFNDLNILVQYWLKE